MASTLLRAARRGVCTPADAGPVGVIGLGNMGGHMARNLLRAGRAVVVSDVSPGAIDGLASAGAATAHSPAEVAAKLSDLGGGARTLVTMLPNNDIVRGVYTGADGILSDRAKVEGTLMIDCSTIAPGVAQEVAKAAYATGCDFVDAPVSGGVVGAEAASLTFMVGANGADIVDRARGVLELMGKKCVHCGTVGSGQAAKLSNNLVLAVSMLGVAEGMLLGQRLGVDAAVLADVFNTSTARCWSSDTYNPVPGVIDGVPASRAYAGGFATNLMLKDLGLALSAAVDAGVPTSGAANAHAAYDAAREAGFGDKDFGAVYALLEQMAEQQGRR